MSLARSRSAGAYATWVAFCLLMVGPLALAAYKVFGLGYRLSDVVPVTEYRVSLQMSLDGHQQRAKVRTFAPESDAHQTVAGEEQTATEGFRFTSENEGDNRRVTWFAARAPDASRIRYEYSVQLGAFEYDISPSLEVPETYPVSSAPDLRPTEAIQVDAPEIVARLHAIGAHQGPLRARLERIFAEATKLETRPFKGTTDALTALRLGEASCNGKSRLFVALSRASGIPARLVGGLILNPGEKRTSHQWAEVSVGGHWVPFCPTNGHFASIPANYLVLYRGDEALFSHTSDTNFDYSFVTTERLVPSAAVRETFQSFNVWDLFARLKLPFSLLRTVLMLPVGALIVVLFRNVVGVPTFGTFLPALIAAATSETGLLWGVVATLLVACVVVVVRLGMQHFRLLHSPTLAILLAVVVLTMLGTSLAADALGIEPLTKISYFPIAVLAIASERLYLTLVEHGPLVATEHLGGTLLVVVGCYVVMNSLAAQILVGAFPELLLCVIAADLYLGRWVGVRVLELWRFRRLLRGEARA